MGSWLSTKLGINSFVGYREEFVVPVFSLIFILNCYCCQLIETRFRDPQLPAAQDQRYRKERRKQVRNTREPERFLVISDPIMRLSALG